MVSLKPCLAALPIVFAVATAAFAQNSPNVTGYLGENHPTNLSRGQTYDFSVSSYTFTPGLSFVTPDGYRLHSQREAILRPWHDGRDYVYTTRTKFYAEKSGTYDVEVFSWDNQEPGQSYSIGANLFGEGGDNGDPPPVIKVKPDGPKPPCPPDNNPSPNYDDLPCAN